MPCPQNRLARLPTESIIGGGRTKLTSILAIKSPGKASLYIRTSTRGNSRHIYFKQKCKRMNSACSGGRSYQTMEDYTPGYPSPRRMTPALWGRCITQESEKLNKRTTRHSGSTRRAPRHRTRKPQPVQPQSTRTKPSARRRNVEVSNKSQGKEACKPGRTQLEPITLKKPGNLAFVLSAPRP